MQNILLIEALSIYYYEEIFFLNYAMFLFFAIMIKVMNLKTIKKVVLCILTFCLIIAVCWISRDIIRHYLNIDALPVLGYHGVVSDKDKEKKYKDNIYFMSTSEFDKQMKYLADQDYECLSMKDVEDYYLGNREISKKAVCLTFDDGYKNFNTVVKPIIEKYNLKATCFVIGYKTTIKNPLYLKQEDLINDQYVEYYSHSYDLHHNAKVPRKKLIETLSVEDIEKDFQKNENIVSDDYFAFPYGISCQNAQTYLEKSDVHLAFGYNENRHLKRSDNQYLLPRYLMFANMPYIYYKWIVQ